MMDPLDRELIREQMVILAEIRDAIRAVVSAIGAQEQD